MSDISFICPDCQQQLEAPNDMSGETIVCPSCQKEMTIPAASANPAVVSNVLLKGSEQSNPALNKKISAKNVLTRNYFLVAVLGASMISAGVALFIGLNWEKLFTKNERMAQSAENKSKTSDKDQGKPTSRQDSQAKHSTKGGVHKKLQVKEDINGVQPESELAPQSGNGLENNSPREGNAVGPKKAKDQVGEKIKVVDRQLLLAAQSDLNNIIEHYNQSDFYRQNFVHDLSRFCKANPECAYLAFDLLMKCLQRESNAQYFGKYQIAYNALADAMIASEFPDEQISKFLEYTIRQYSGSAVAKPTGNYMKLLRKYRNKTTEIAENMIEIANAGHSQFGDSSSKYKIQRLIDGLDANDDKQ